MNTPQRVEPEPEAEHLTPTMESALFNVGDKVVISPDSINLNAERRKLRDTKKVMKVVKLLKNDYVLAKVTPKKEIRLQTSKLKLSEPSVDRQIYIQE
eukprot:SAG11_NODE_9053_length_948_cov_5.323910_1_plen_98_part_00